MEPKLHVIDHPLIQHKLTLMRMKDTPTATFRSLLNEISSLMAYEVFRYAPTTLQEIETPLMRMKAPLLEGKKIAVVAILRAGIGMLDGVLDVVPSARIGHVGLYRDHDTLEAVEYYFKVPEYLSARTTLVVDPMLATGNSAIAALNKVKSAAPKSIKFMCLVAAPEGIKALHAAHPDVPIYTPAVDERLNEKGYILPGLGDAGDRIFGTG